MNGLHDHHHKRTSITELLNPSPVPSNAPSSSLDPALAGPFDDLTLPAFGTAPAHHDVQQVPYHPVALQVDGPGSSFSLRAANWEQAENQHLTGRPPDDDPTAVAAAAACRYNTNNNSNQSHPPPPVHHSPVYPDQYHQQQRPRSVDVPANYGIDVHNWPPSSHDPVQYAAPVLSPIYQDERTGNYQFRQSSPALISPYNIHAQTVQASEIHKNYTPQIQYEQQHQDMSAQYAHNAFQNAERVSVRLLAQRTIPQQIPPQHRMPQMYMGHPGIALIPVMLQQPQSTPPPKRPISPETDEPRAKKAKGKGKIGDAASKRGNNNKKRSESMQVTIPNGVNGKTKDRASSISSIPSTPSELSMVIAQDGSMAGLQPELQFARCMSNRYRNEEFPRCVSCTRRWAGDTCRFQGIRYFLKNPDRAIVGISFIEAMKADGPSMNFPVKWNVPLQLAHIARIKKTVAVALLPVLKQESEHIMLKDIIRRPRESDVRATCDTCMTSIFSSSWMCRLCGREACHECFEQVKELTTDRPGATEAEQAALQARREKHAHINPFFLSCTRRNEHRAVDFSPMTRFAIDELRQAISDMEALLTESPSQAVTDAAPGESSNASTLATLLDGGSANGVHSHTGNGSANGTRDLSTSPVTVTSTGADQALPLQSDSAIPPQPSTSNASFSQPPSPHSFTTSSIPSHVPRYFTDAELTDDVFRELWLKGEPLVVTDVLKKFTLQWTPEYFKTKYGSQSCLILECQNDQNKRMTVGEFFSLFGQYEGRRDCWKLKDWPPSTDFKTAFPELYEDFSSATPVPNYVRRDGVLNVASHFPSNAIGPDLGPKMYNAMASFESQGSKGSTRLHMDMADAANIMMYAANTPDGRPGTAAWDLFKAEDSPKIRKFLRKRFKGQYQHDPIHSQQFYLDSQLRQELFDEFQVKSYRVYQRPGDVVFIPAGCAHQVCNLADCIKVACDFVSPENISRCEILTKEFREQNQSMAWKEDVLQLRTMMWFAWLSCGRQEKELAS